MFNEGAHPNSKITREIIGCAMRVHSELGNGFQEAVYQRALSIELRLCGIEHRREVEMPIFTKVTT
jgi:GxxExxY protein